jgi:hypothetical protein
MSFLQRTLREIAQNKTQSEYFSRFKGLPFWIWDKEAHSKIYDETKAKHGGKPRCCFNHCVPAGLPSKIGRGKLPLFPYEREVIDALEKHNLVFIVKATGLGISELALRYIAWLCTRNNDLSGSQIIIITGPRIELTISLLNRFKALFPNFEWDEKQTTATINNVTLEVFPSHHLSSARGLPRVAMVYLDEADHFGSTAQSEEARTIAERYLGKNERLKILLVSTPFQPGGMFQQIETAKESIYHRLRLPYSVGLGTIYTPEEIKLAMSSLNFEREYNLAYVGQVGNLFTNEEIQRAIELGDTYDPDMVRTDTYKVLSLDPSYSSSQFGFCVAELGHAADGSDTGQINILVADELDHPLFNEAVNFFADMIYNYQINRVYVDGSQVAFIASLKAALGENPNYQQELQYFKDNGQDPEEWSTMKVLPVNFSTEHKKMLEHCKEMMPSIAINRKFDKLITALRTATATEFSLDKNLSVHNDIFDAYRMCCRWFIIKEKPFHQQFNMPSEATVINEPY